MLLLTFNPSGDNCGKGDKGSTLSLRCCAKNILQLIFNYSGENYSKGHKAVPCLYDNTAIKAHRISYVVYLIFFKLDIQHNSEESHTT